MKHSRDRKHAAKGNSRWSASTKFETYDDTSNVHQLPIRKAAVEPLKAKTRNQEKYIAAIKQAGHEGGIVFGIGPAGTGKTFCAAAYAADRLKEGSVERVIITRPAIEVGASMGFLPGTLEEKYAPFLMPFRDAMVKRLGQSTYEYELKHERISPQPLAYMRGASFENSIIILDEAQNCTPAEMLMFLTRIGEQCTVIISGDIMQCDLPGKSGLEDAIERISWIPQVRVVEFTEDDIVRSALVKEVIQSYRRR